MVCIYCGNPTKVVNSRKTVRANQTWRRRKCISCHAIFTTTEAVDFLTTFTIQHEDGHLVPFSAETLLISLHESLRHRKNASSDASAICRTVINQIIKAQRQEVKRGLVPLNTVRRCVLQCLQQFDNAAATHYAAYHPEK